MVLAVLVQLLGGKQATQQWDQVKLVTSAVQRILGPRGKHIQEGK